MEGGSSSFPSLGEGEGLEKGRLKTLLAIGRERADRKSVKNFILSSKVKRSNWVGQFEGGAVLSCAKVISVNLHTITL